MTKLKLLQNFIKILLVNLIISYIVIYALNLNKRSDIVINLKFELIIIA
jgi:hypothetical protein